LRVVFLGTSDYAVTVLRRLAASDHEPALVVTPPDRPRGRGRKLAPTPVAAAASDIGLDLVRAASVNDATALERIRAAAPDIGVVCAFGQLIRDPLLSELELLNVHPSLIPRWRGAAPIERAIMAADEETGVTIMRVTAGLDSGPVALQERAAIGDADFGTLAARLAALGGELAVRALDLAERGELEFTDQDDSAATYADKIRPQERRLDPARPAPDLARTVRALNPHIGTYLELAGGGRLGVRAARAEPGALAVGELASDDGTLRVGCTEGVLRLDNVQPAGGRAMTAEAYLRGHAPPRLG
jgi:methionyl-tRNA formyltransferase